MHADWRTPQLVTQVDIDERSRLFLQAAIQVFSSPLQRIGAEEVGAAKSTAKAAEIETVIAVLCKRCESIRRTMPMS